MSRNTATVFVGEHIVSLLSPMQKEKLLDIEQKQSAWYNKAFKELKENSGSQFCPKRLGKAL